MMPPPLHEIELKPGLAWMTGPPCRICEHGRDFPVTGAIVKMPAAGDGIYTCARCEGEIRAIHGYATPQTGHVKLYAGDANGRPNPYLYPATNHIGDQPLEPTADDQSDLWRHYGLDDVGNAHRLSLLNGDWFRFVPQWGWMVYNGTYWERDTSGARMMTYAVHTAKTMLAECKPGGTIDVTTDAGKQFLKHAERTNRKGALESMIAVARTIPGVLASVDDFAGQPHLLNVKNGVVDLTTGKLRDHRATDYATAVCDVVYDPWAPSVVWDQFLDQFTSGDEDLAKFLQRAAGYSITGEVTEQCLFFLFGDGANGKSTFVEAIRSVLGGYGHTLAFEALLSGRSGEMEKSMAYVAGKRFVVAAEAPEGRSFNESVIKQSTGQDTLVGRHLYQDAFEFQPTHKFWLVANHKPAIRGTDEGIWRRFKAIPIQAHFPQEQRDKHLAERLQTEVEGIIAWLVRGAVAWYARGLSEPQIIRDAMQQYRSDMDLIGQFLEECCEVGEPGDFTANSVLAPACNHWLKESGERPLSTQAMSARLSRHRAGLLRPGKAFGQRGWFKVRLKAHMTDSDDGSLRRFH